MTADRVFELPDIVLRRLAAEGNEAWAAGLPALVAGLQRDWEIEVGKVFSGGSEALVTEATLADGTPAILKVLSPREDDLARHEADALRLADGVGCAKLFRDDRERNAMLLERLGRPLADLGLEQDERLPILCEAAMRCRSRHRVLVAPFFRAPNAH